MLNSDKKGNEYNKLGEITIKKERYYFNPNKKELSSNFNDLTNLSWLVYKGKRFPDKNRQYRIQEGDVIKIGRIWLIVKEIRINKNSNKKENVIEYDSYSQDMKNEFTTNCSPLNQNIINSTKNFNVKMKKRKSENCNKLYKSKKAEEKKNSINDVLSQQLTKSSTNNKIVFTRKSTSHIHYDNKKTKIKSKPICRICYMEEDESKTNPLIQPCSCSGSMRYIHLKCLRHWLSSKILVKATTYTPIDFCTTYSINMVQCELCKERLPDFIRHKGQLFNLLEFNETSSDKDNYIVFDTISPDSKNNRFRYFVKFDSNDTMKIGRGLEVQLMLSDISVSRIHTVLRIVNGDKVILEDFNSKFGTLVLLQCPSIEILNGQRLTIQIGRTYMNIEIKQSFQLFNCCNVNEYDRSKSYERINRRYVHFDKTTYIKEDNGYEEVEESDEETPNEEKKRDSVINVVKKGDGFLKVISEENNKEEIQNEEMLIINAKRKKTAFGDNLLQGKSKDD